MGMRPLKKSSYFLKNIPKRKMFNIFIISMLIEYNWQTVQYIIQLKMKGKAYTIYNTPEYDEWLDEQSAKNQVQVRQRISHIQDDGYFGDHKDVDDGV